MCQPEFQKTLQQLFSRPFLYFMNNRKVLKYHSYAGLVAGFVLVLMRLSGAILVFQHDIDDYRWQEYIEVDNFSGLHIDRGIFDNSEKLSRLGHPTHSF
ncbi:PepSY domain-containing protein [Salinimicrobium sp. WS361]|uniref:PepSY domain-containing protein n=1 Tax=Salinimicrobium sp. WS361 TaxID=3425123 RepID=UPI003D6E2EEA